MCNSLLLSILIPVYNGEKFISRCLTSIYSQDVERDLFEVIIINDGSIDNTKGIVLDYKSRFNNVTLIDKDNEGVSVARNCGVNAAKGIFVGFLDADDELFDCSLSLLLETLRDTDAELLITNTWNCDKTGMSKRNVPNLEAGKRYSGVEAFNLGYQRMNAGGAICRKSVIQKYNLNFPVGITNGEDTIYFSVFQTVCQDLRYKDIDFYKVHIVPESASRRLSIDKINGMCRAVVSMNNIRQTLSCHYDNRIVEFTLYLLVSNLINATVCVKEANVSDIIAFIKKTGVLPIDNSKFIHNKTKASLLNKSVYLFYYLVAIKNRLVVK